MAHLVTIKTGTHRVALPNGISYPGGAQALLSDLQYSVLSQQFKADFLTDDFLEGGSTSEVQVTSVFGRSGEIAAQSGDYAASQVTGAATAASVTAEATRAEAAEAQLIPLSQKGAANGVATLGSGGIIPSGQVPPLVASVTAGDASVAVTGPAISPVIRAGALDQIASLHPPQSAVAMNGQRVTGAASAVSSGDLVTLGQLGSAALQPTSAFDAAGAASAEATRALAAEALLAPKASPSFTGTPVAPTASAKAASTQLATTAYADAAVSALGTLLAKAAATSLSGTALGASTGTVITWTAPSDGQMHRVLLLASLVVSVLEVGGLVTLAFTDPGGTSRSSVIFAAGLAAGPQLQLVPGGVQLIAPGSTVTLAQSSGLSAGAATLWAELWAS